MHRTAADLRSSVCGFRCGGLLGEVDALTGTHEMAG
jgi:hypothetical protein